MKIQYLFSTLLAAAVLSTGCEQASTEAFDNIKLDKTYLSIAEEGGNVVLTVNATEDWAFVVTDIWPDVIKRDKEGNVEEKTPSWLSSDKMDGKAGETKVTFSADATAGGRELELSIKAGANTQFIRVRQGSMEPQLATCAEVNAAPDGKTFLLKGVCTSIENTQYGNWWLKDETGEVYIYGTLDKDGKTKNFASLGLEVGDEVTISGPKGSYKDSPQMVNVSVVNIKKSLVKVVDAPAEIPEEGGKINVRVAYKGNGVFVDQLDSWIVFDNMTYKKGEPSKIEPNPCDTAIVSLSVLANTGEESREGSVTFSSHSGSVSSNVKYMVQQAAPIFNVSITDFLDSPVNERKQYRVSGTVTEWKPNIQYQNIDVRIEEETTGKVLYIHRMKADEGHKVEDLDVKVGDVLTVVGNRGEYKGSPQMVNGVYESHISK